MIPRGILSHFSAFLPKSFICLTAVLVFLGAAGVSAYADGESEVRSGIYSVYEAVRVVSLPLAVIGIAGSAVRMVTGNASSAAAAKRRIVLILSAAAALWLVPAALSFGAGIFSGMAWSPGG